MLRERSAARAGVGAGRFPAWLSVLLVLPLAGCGALGGITPGAAPGDAVPPADWAQTSGDRGGIGGVPLPPLVLLAPLTGEPVSGSAAERPVIAVPIAVGPGIPPPTGLDVADVVVEQQLEGGRSRLLALYQSRDANVSPVVELVQGDLRVLPTMKPIVATAPARPSILNRARAIGLSLAVDSGDSTGYIDTGASPPYGRAVETARLSAAAGAAAPTPRPLLVFDTGGTLPERRAEASWDAPLGSEGVRTWTWEESVGRWNATVGGTRIAVANVIVAEVPTEGTASDATTNLRPVGRGPALVATAGGVTTAAWVRRNTSSPLALLAADLSPLQLAAGSSWVVLVPPGTLVPPGQAA